VKSILTAGLGALLLLSLLAGCAKPLPVFGAVPEFSLKRESGEPVSKKSLEGGVWVADFIYTGCSEACPLLSMRMSELQKRLEKVLPIPLLVSISVDPETDTPERLSAYAKRYGADPSRWMFLTGDSEVIQKTVTEGFKLSDVKSKEDGSIFHANKFVLVDRRGRIRGYYESEEAGVKRLMEDLPRLQREE